MHDERTGSRREGANAASNLAEQDAIEDGMVLVILLDDDRPGLWSVEEVIRAFGNRVTVGDSLLRLERDGLIHRLDKFVFPTRAAIRAGEIDV